jgi:hypothetical protein
MRSRVATALRDAKLKGRKITVRGALRFVGCSIVELADYLELQFVEGMSWQNFGRGGWNVDHIFPVGRADMSDIAQVQAVFHWRNCQPLWESDNIRKRDRVTAEARALFDTLVEGYRSSEGSGPAPRARERKPMHER